MSVSVSVPWNLSFMQRAMSFNASTPYATIFVCHLFVQRIVPSQNHANKVAQLNLLLSHSMAEASFPEPGFACVGWTGLYYSRPIFTARGYAKRGICRRRVSVCLSHSGNVSKRLNVGSVSYTHLTLPTILRV